MILYTISKYLVNIFFPQFFSFYGICVINHCLFEIKISSPNYVYDYTVPSCYMQYSKV